MLIDLLRHAAVDVPDRPVVVTRHHELHYAACLGRAEMLGRGLHSRAIDRFACRVDDVGELIALLCGASAVGSEPCVYPDRLDEAGVEEFAERFGHDVVLTDDDLDGLAKPGRDVPRSRASPVLVLTTGTTGEPKGVRHDWERLVRSVRRPDDRPGARWLLAYNLNQFAGLQILLHVLASRATLVVGESRRPRDAVAAMGELGVTHVSTTPTFWRLAAGMLDEPATRDLQLEQLTLGGEAVPELLLERLKRRFPQARISQVYAANEFGSAVSVSDGRSGLPLSVLERDPDAEVQFRIVDGELQARSRVGMLGYFGEGHTSDGWRPTGDLVEVRGGRIHFVGRTSEIINVGGVKVHPLPVEEAVAAVDGVQVARAYGRANPVAGQIVTVDVVAHPGVDTDQLGTAIQAACEALPSAARPRRVRFVDSLEMRDSKLARTKAPS